MFKNTLQNDKDNCFSLLHNSVRSLKRNLDNLQVHLLDELDYNLSVLGVTETKITNTNSLDFKPNLPNYEFECPNTSTMWRCWNLHEQQPELHCH